MFSKVLKIPIQVLSKSVKHMSLQEEILSDGFQLQDFYHSRQKQTNLGIRWRHVLL